ncbi:MAG: hypothetical protein ACU85V_14175, partial [Gammaproteobacteria bacterium]
MADAPYAVIFQGRIAEGADPAEVRAKLAKLFNADAARIEAMFSGRKVVIKKGLDAAGAKKYRAVLAKAGALVDVIDVTKTSAKKPPSAPAAPEPAAATPAPAPGPGPDTPPGAASLS